MLLTTIREIGWGRFLAGSILGAAGVYAACWVFLVLGYALVQEPSGFPPGVILVQVSR